MENKGFTLIELLAVITILAIIALITSPIIIDTIEESKKSSALRSAELYVDAIDSALASKNLNGDFYIENGWYTINKEGNICTNEECTDFITIKAKNKPTSGKIYIEKSKAADVEYLKIQNYNINKNDKGKFVIADENSNESSIVTIGNCTLDGNLDYNVQVTCNGDKFHVVAYDDNTVTLFSDKNITTNLSNPEQVDAGSNSITFSEEIYWMGNCTYYETSGASCGEQNSNYPTNYIYDSNSNLYPYVEAYKAKLIDAGISVQSARIPINSDTIHMEKIQLNANQNAYYIGAVNNIPSAAISAKVNEINAMSESEFREYALQYEIIQEYSMFFDFTKEEQAKFLILIENSTPEQIQQAKSLLYGYPTWVNSGTYWFGESFNEMVYTLNQIDSTSGEISSVDFNSNNWNIGIRPVIIINR